MPSRLCALQSLNRGIYLCNLNESLDKKGGLKFNFLNHHPWRKVRC